MKRIFKYKIEITDEQVILLPPSGDILHFGLQNDVPYIWVKVDPERTTVKRWFKLVGTGHRFEDGFKVDGNNHILDYIGTVVGHQNTFVWHLFEMKETFL